MNTDRIHTTSKFDAVLRTGPSGVFVVWQPGDGTRYVFLFTHTVDLLVTEGYMKDSVVATILYGGQSIVFGGQGGLLHMNTLREKLPSLQVSSGIPHDLNKRDSSTMYALAAVANWLYGNTGYADEVYREMAKTFDFKPRL